MKNRLTWIQKTDFLDRALWAPFHIEKDIDYYDNLCEKYRMLLDCATSAGADEESLRIIKRFSNKVKESIRNYYYGKISTTHTQIKNLLKEIMNNSLAVSTINDSKAFPGEGKEIQFYRARNAEIPKTFAPKEMLHIPFPERGKTGNYRFSIPGIPSIYLGNSTYACWVELGCPSDHDFNVSAVLLDGTQRLLNLAVMTRKIWDLKECDEEYVHTWLKLLILMIATSYVIEEKDRIFKSEYVVSQSIMLGCKELGLDGVAYYSKRVYDEAFANAAVNVALFTDFKMGKKYSDVCKHMKIDDSYNFALFKHLGLKKADIEYKDYRLAQTGVATNIGDYKRQFSYHNTDFCMFDQFLFSTWKDKDSIEFGNALM